MIQKKELDIIIVNYNSTNYTFRCIESIYENEKKFFNLHIIVVDNKSEDNPQNLKTAYPEVDLIFNKKNIGFSRAVNIGLRRTTAEFCVLLNPDTVVHGEFLIKILNYIEKHEDVAIVGPRILEQNGEIQGSARKFPTLLTSIFGRKSFLTKIFPNNPFTKKEFFSFGCANNLPIEVDWVSGACMVARRSALDVVGGFDERYFLYWEDADLCKNLRDKGWKIIYYPKVQVKHHTGCSSSTVPIHSIFHFHKSSYLLYKKTSSAKIRIFIPFVFWALAIRCLFAIALNCIHRSLQRRNIVFTENSKGTGEFGRNEQECFVLRVISRLNIGGPSIHCSILEKGLNKSRFRTKLIFGTVSPFEGDMSYLLSDFHGELLKVPELQREINFLKDIKALIRITIILFKEKPDVVHSHMAKAGAVSRTAVFFHNLISNKKIKTVHTFHGHVLEGYFNNLESKIFIRIEKLLAKVTDYIIAISHTQKWELSNKFKIASIDKIRTINLGFDLSPFQYANKIKGKFRKQINVAPDTKMIGIVGRLVPIKNHKLFLDSAKIYIDSNPGANIKFVIIGDGELRAWLESYASEIGISAFVYFHGWEKEIRAIYADLDILALTSNNEGTPVSIIEAMAANVPVITTGVGGVKDLLGKILTEGNDGCGYVICERGILCPKDDAMIFAKGLDYLTKVIGNVEQALHTSETQAFVTNQYSDWKLIENIEHLYKELTTE